MRYSAIFNEENLDNLSNRRPTPLFVFLVFVVTIGSSLLCGWHLSVLNNSVTAIEQLINSSLYAHYSYNVTSKSLTLFNTALSTVYVGGGTLGALTIRFISERFGRRKPMVFLSSVGIIGTILMSISQPINSFEALLLSRIIMGIHGGIYMGLAPMYISECAAVAFRGAATTFFSLGITIGIFLASTFALDNVLGGIEYLWILFGLPLIPIIIHMIGVWFCPSSPKHSPKNNFAEESPNAMTPLRKGSNIETERNEKLEEPTLMDLIKSKRWRKMLIVASVISIGQQLSGVNGIIFYSKQTFVASGIDPQQASYGTLGISAALFTGSLIGIFLIDRMGRRPLLIMSFFSMSLACFALVPLLKFSGSTCRTCSIIAIVAIMVFMITFQIGPGGISWMLTPEMFPQEVRSVAVGLTTGLIWNSSLLIAIIFPLLQEAISHYTFVLFGLLNAAFFVFTVFKVRETKNKTPEEIEKMYS